MKKKSLRPIQTAPVQRDTTATTTSASSCGGTISYGTMVAPSILYLLDYASSPWINPFAGDDGE